MDKELGDEFGVVWRNQTNVALRFRPEQLREMAEQFEKHVRFRYMRDQACFGLVAVAFFYGLIAIDGALFRLGCGLLLLWVVHCMYGLHRFGSVLSRTKPEENESCAAHHRRQLTRQRDIALSRPLGVSLAAPGFLLLAIGSSLGPRQLPWEGTIGLVGVFSFVCLAVVIQGRIAAGQLQAEIDEVKAMSDQTE